MVHDELSRAKTTSRPNSMMHKDQFVVTRNKKNPNYFRSTKYKTTYRNINGLEITRFIHVIGENLIWKSSRPYLSLIFVRMTAKCTINWYYISNKHSSQEDNIV